MSNSYNPFSIAGKVVVLTGAAGFLGRGYIDALLEVGAIVVAWDRNKELLRQTSLELPQVKKKKFFFEGVELTDEDAVNKAVATVLRHSGRIDGLINNAAMNPAIGSDESAKQFAPYEDYDIGLFRREIDANLTTMMIVIKHVIQPMIRDQSGSIINIASEVSTIAHDHRVYGVVDKHKSPAYTASKTAVLGLTRQLASRYGRFNIRVNAISIGGVHKEGMPEDFAARFGATNMLGRMARAGEYAPSLIYLLSEASSFMTGANLIIDGGKSAW